MKILYAENDLLLAKERKRVMEEAGHDVMHASSPEEAEDFLKRGTFDIMLTDLRLYDDHDPIDTSGMSLIKAAKSEYPDLLTILYTRTLPAAIDPLHMRFKEAGGNRIILKQDGADVMLRALEEVYAQRNEKSM